MHARIDGGKADPTHPTADDAVWFDDSVDVALGSRAGAGGSVHYTLDGSAPTTNSAIAQGPLVIASILRLRA